MTQEKPKLNYRPAFDKFGTRLPVLRVHYWAQEPLRIDRYQEPSIHMQNSMTGSEKNMGFGEEGIFNLANKLLELERGDTTVLRLAGHYNSNSESIGPMIVGDEIARPLDAGEDGILYWHLGLEEPGINLAA